MSNLQKIKQLKNKLYKHQMLANRDISQFIKDELDNIEMAEIISPFGGLRKTEETINFLNNWESMYNQMLEEEMHFCVFLENEIEKLEKENDDLDVIIKAQLRKNYIKIETTQGHYPEEQIWVYKNFFGLDINNSQELQKAEKEGIFREMMSW